MHKNLATKSFAVPIMSNRPNHAEVLNEAMVNASGHSILVTDVVGVVQLSNRIAQEVLAIHPGSILNEILPELWQHVKQTLNDFRKRVGISIHSTNANFLVRISPVFADSEMIGVSCVLVESTDLEDMAKQLQLFKNQAIELNAIIDSSSDGLWICDADANVIRVNPASEKLNNIRAVEVVGKNMRELVSQGYFEKSATMEVIRIKGLVNLIQQREGHKLIVTGTPVFDARGNLIRVVVTERDITEIDTLQRELEKQSAIKDQICLQMLELQHAELISRKVIAKSPCMITALNRAIKASNVHSTVLILGESGVGKGVISEIIHRNSSRADMSMIKINCGAIPESLIESELFGYEKGAFTGAQNIGKPGFFELSDGGILFLDEIAELPLSSQVKLLRFLEDGCVMRLGGTKERTVNVRIIAATHRNLEEMVNQGKFRLDLYYRLKVIPIYVPALRERRECLLSLIDHYIDHFGTKNGIKKRLTRNATDALLDYQYPGNVRELMNICEHLVVMADADVIDVDDLPIDIIRHKKEGSTFHANLPDGVSLFKKMNLAEKNYLEQALLEHGSQSKIAKALGVNQSTIARKLKKFGLR